MHCRAGKSGDKSRQESEQKRRFHPEPDLTIRVRGNRREKANLNIKQVAASDTIRRFKSGVWPVHAGNRLHQLLCRFS